MKNLLAVSVVVVVTGCTSTVVEKPRVQSMDEAVVTLDTHSEKVNMSRNFCSGKGFSYYSETSVSYSFRCLSYFDDKDRYVGGGYFHLVK